jgi:hypothetical protein
MARKKAQADQSEMTENFDVEPTVSEPPEDEMSMNEGGVMPEGYNIGVILTDDDPDPVDINDYAEMEEGEEGDSKQPKMPVEASEEVESIANDDDPWLKSMEFDPDNAGFEED